MATLSWAAELRGPRATWALGEALGRRAAPGLVLGLQGDLGAGKTTFVQGLAAGWGVAADEDVVSPTYALLHLYDAPRGPLVHIDIYRLGDAELVRSLGLEESIARRDALVAVEWADRLPGLLPPNAAWIHLVRLTAETRRVEARGVPPLETWPPGVHPSPKDQPAC